MDLKDRFLKYVSFDTQSDEMSETFPSTEKQKVLLKYLVEEMKSLGLTEVEMDLAMRWVRFLLLRVMRIVRRLVLSLTWTRVQI